MGTYLSCDVRGAHEARQGLRDLAGVLRSSRQAHHAAAHDLLLFYASTRVFFTATEMDTVVSPPVCVWWDKAGMTIGAHGTGGKHQPEEGPGSPMGKRRTVAYEEGCKDRDLCKTYRPHYLWGQLVSWFKQTVYDPSASLSADRRGTLSLPDPESAYERSFRNYAQ